jgi:hypothetical protein
VWMFHSHKSLTGILSHYNNNNKLFISKMVSQVCTITNNSPETIGSVTSFSGYNPLLTFIDF